MNEVLMSPEVLSNTHERQDFRSTSHTYRGWELVPIAILLPALHEEISGNLVVFDPDVICAEDCPLIYRAERLVEVTKVPRRFCSGDRYAPELADAEW